MEEEKYVVREEQIETVENFRDELQGKESIFSKFLVGCDTDYPQVNSWKLPDTTLIDDSYL